jgi:hypothetical protein
MNYSAILDILSFLKNPQKYLYTNSENNSKSSFSNLNIFQKLIFFSQIISFSAVLAWFAGVLGTGIISFFTEYSVTENNLIFQGFLDYGPLTVFFLVVFLGPLIEELAFRLFFSEKKGVFFTGLIFFWFFITNIIIEIIVQIFNLNPENTPWLGFLFLASLIFIIVLVVILNLLISKEKLANFIKKNFNWFFYSISITFGLIHITNYTNLNLLLILLSPLLVLPQLLVGTAFGYIRVRFNFLTAFLAHSVYNFLLGGSVFLLLFYLDTNTLKELIENINSGQISALAENLDPSQSFFLNIFLGLIMFSYFVIFTIFLWTIWDFFKVINSSKKSTETTS